MRSIAIDDPGVCQFATRANCAKTADWIDVLFEVSTPGNPRNPLLDGGLHLLRRGVLRFYGLCQITLATLICEVAIYLVVVVVV